MLTSTPRWHDSFKCLEATDNWVGTGSLQFYKAAAYSFFSDHVDDGQAPVSAHVLAMVEPWSRRISGIIFSKTCELGR